MNIYFDSAATTKPSDSAVSAAKNALEYYGNPSSLHRAGRDARNLIENARKSVAKALFCKPEEITFTSCGSESNSTALYSLCEMRKRRSNRIITTDCEHPSVSAVIDSLAKQGFEVIRIPTLGGVLDLDILETELKKGASFVAIMLVNNETGAKLDIPSVRRLIDRSGCGALLHCDAVQGFLKVDDAREIAKNCDTASISAHKIGGFKGVGALYAKKGVRLTPFLLGGGQESGIRSGTENVIGISAFGAACESFDIATKNRISELRDYLIERLSQLDGTVLNLPKCAIGSILSVQVRGVRSEVLLNALSSEGICISAGSACSAKKGPSGVLTAFGLTKEEIDCTVRISIGADNTKEECDILVETLDAVAKRLRR